MALDPSSPTGAPARIERATRDDVAAIVAISNDAAARGYANFATEPEPLAAWLASFDATAASHPWLVARTADGAVVAFARAAPHRTRGAYRWTADVSVYVADGHAGGGLGARLYDALVPTLWLQGYVTIMAGVALPNPASVALHEAFGFVRAGTFPRVGWKDGAWRDVGYWALTLRADDAPPGPIRSVGEAWLALELADEASTSPDASALIAATNAEIGALYPEAGATHFRLDPDETAPGRGAFVVARGGGEAVACGGQPRQDAATCELKRMYVAPAWRGRGVAARVLMALERRARRLGATHLALETGARQPAAVALYTRMGFAPSRRSASTSPRR
ncbi:MAG: GNAT family N-acetyltransferase [Myxococcota bacterium]